MRHVFFGILLTILSLSIFSGKVAAQSTSCSDDQKGHITAYAIGNPIATDPNLTIDQYLVVIDQYARTKEQCTLTPTELAQYKNTYTGLHATPTPTPAPQPGSGGGVPVNDKDCGKLGFQCCYGTASATIDTSEIQQPGGGDTICVPIFNICLEGIIRNITGFVANVTDTATLNKIGTCNKTEDVKIGTDQDGKDIVRPVHLVPEYSLKESTSNDTQCICKSEEDQNLVRAGLCKYIRPNSDQNHEYVSCTRCIVAGGTWSALGCMHTDDWKAFIEGNLLGLGVSFGGLAAFLCIIYAAFIFQTSSGNPERIKNAQQLMTSCIMGLMLIIFSIFILRLIGVTILHIPGLG